jgi:integrase
MPEFKSNFKEHISGLIAEKKALGYKYDLQAIKLADFDDFCSAKFPDEVTLTRELMLEWAAIRKYEHPKTLEGRVVPVRELAKYLVRMGQTPYMIPPNMLPKMPHYTPYIYSNDELRRYFEQTDKLAYYNPIPYRHLVLPLLIRFLYTCGLRVTETTLIKFGEVDTENGIITINNAKCGRVRQIPVSDSMLVRIKDYCAQVHKNSSPDAWFFPYSRNGDTPIKRNTVERNHLEFLWKAGISHCGKSREPGKPGGPRIHDFRHTFAVHCLRRWAFEGKNIGAMMPYLQTYLGHVTQNETAYYLHLTADVFPQIIAQLEDALGAIVPEIPLEVWNNGY